MANKVLILGSQGNLGSQLEIIFNQDKNYKVVSWDKKDLDITNEKEMDAKIVQLRPDVIINASAYNAVDECEKNKKEFKLASFINGTAVGALAETAKKIKALFIHYSTDYVFDGNKKEGYREDDIPNPINKYGETKLLGEKLIQKIKDKNFKYYIIRTSKLFGQPGKSEFSKKSFFDIMLELGERSEFSKKEIAVVNEEVSCFTYTKDLARATKNLLSLNKKKGVYHITNNFPCTWYEAAEILFKIVGKKIKIKSVKSDFFPRPARRPKYSILLNTKVEPLRSWPDALEEYLTN